MVASFPNANASDVAVASDGQGGAFVAWNAMAPGDPGCCRLYLSHLTNAGTVAWVGPISPAVETVVKRATLVPDGSGGVTAAWVTGAANLRAQRYSSAGVPHWSSVADPGVVSYDPAIASDGAGGFIAGWSRWTGSSFVMAAQRVTRDGALAWSGLVTLSSLGSAAETVGIAPDGAGGALVTWTDARSFDDRFTPDIFAQRVTAAGQVLWGADGVVVTSARGGQRSPRVVSDGAGGGIVVWHDCRRMLGAECDVYARGISASGAVQGQPGGVPLNTSPGNQGTRFGTPAYPGVAAVTDGSGGVIASWPDGRAAYCDPGTSPSACQMFADRLSASDLLRSGTAALVLSSLAPSFAATGSGDITVTASGANFTASSTVMWNRALQSTTFVSATELRVTFTAADLAQTANAEIAVYDPGAGEGFSNALTFVVSPAADIVGSWRLAGVETRVDGDGIGGWLTGRLTFGAPSTSTGAPVVDGSIVRPAGTQPAPTGVLNQDSRGRIEGYLGLTPIFEVTGTLALANDIVTLTGTSGFDDRFGLFLLVRDGPTPTLASLAGSWRVHAVTTPDTVSTRGAWVDGRVTMDAFGGVTSGSIALPDRTVAITGGSAVLGVDGTVTITIAAGGDTATLLTALTPAGNAGAGVITTRWTNRSGAITDRGAVMLTRAATDITLADLAGTWDHQQFHVLDQVGNLGFWIDGTVTIAPDGTVDGSLRGPSGPSSPFIGAVTGVGGEAFTLMLTTPPDVEPFVLTGSLRGTKDFGAATVTVATTIDFETGPVAVTLYGVSTLVKRAGIGGPVLSVSPATFDFGEVVVGDTATRVVTVRNTGTGTLTGTATGGTVFTFVGSQMFILAAGESAELTVAFQPRTLGRVDEILSFGSNGGTRLRSLAGTGIARRFVLSVVRAGTGTGTVASNPAGVSCGSDCSESYLEGTLVTLTATPDTRAVFLGWTGACTGTGTCQVSMGAQRSVTATFGRRTLSAPTSAPVTGPLVVSFGNGPLGSGEWIGLFPSGGGTYVDWKWLSDTQTTPLATRDGTVQFPTTGRQLAAGTYVVRWISSGAVLEETAIVTLAVAPPAPTLTRLEPATVVAGTGPVTVTAVGTGFTSTSSLRVGGVARATTLVSATELRTTLTASDVVTVGTSVQMTVLTAPLSGLGGGASEMRTLDVVAAPGRPTITVLSPTTVAVGATGVEVTVDGTEFTVSSRVRLNGVERATAWVSGMRLRVTLTATDVASGGTRAITVTTPAPGGGTSDAATLTVVGPAIGLLDTVAPLTGPIRATFANGPGRTGEWIAVFPASGGGYVDWQWVAPGGSRT